MKKTIFEDTDSIISDSLRFKIKLSIGEDAYTSLRLKKSVYEAWDSFGMAATTATVVKSSAVASTFFAPSGFLAALGFGAAVTPIGWVIAAALVSGGAWAGVSRYVNKQPSNKVTVIPKFINTPLDVIALALFDLMAPLALKMANIDGHIDQSENEYISQYFIQEWGYSKSFVADAILLTSNNLANFNIKELACNLAEFQKGNPDCNYKEMSNEMILFLNGVMESDGRIDEREELAIEKIENIFEEAGKYNISKSIKNIVNVSTDFMSGGLKKSFLSTKNNKTT